MEYVISFSLFNLSLIWELKKKILKSIFIKYLIDVVIKKNRKKYVHLFSRIWQYQLCF